DHNALVSLVSSVDAGTERGLVAGGHGATRLPAFVTETYAMPDVEEIPDRWREEHLARQRQVFTRYPEDMSSLAVRDVPAGLDGTNPPAGQTEQPPPTDARRVADEGELSESALRDQGASARETVARQTGTVHPVCDDPTDADREPGYAANLFQSARAKKREGTNDGGGYDERLFDPGGPDAAHPSRSKAKSPAGPGWESVGGVRIERAEDRPPDETALTAASPVLHVACRPTDRPLPGGDLRPATDAAMQAVREAATFEAISSLPEWSVAGDEARTQAATAANVAREQALAEAQAAGLDQDEARRTAERRARRAAAETLASYGDALWRMPLKELKLGETDIHTLELIARLRLTAPVVLTQLLAEPAKERAVRDRLARLHDGGLIARSEVAIEGRRGRR
ncbi:MAG: hypothetical protein ACREX8_12730, partial [Gammaproteobacteria bacterium]